MTETQTALGTPNPNEQVAIRKPSRLLLLCLVLAPFVSVWFLLRKGYSPATRVAGFVWTIIFTCGLQLLQYAQPAEQRRSQPAAAIAAQPEPSRATFENGIFVTKVNFEARGLVWPLTVEEAYIGCDKGLLLWIAVDGEKYGLNGTAIDWGYPSFRPFWRDDPASPANGSGPGVRIQDLFDAAKATCSTSD